MNLKITLSFILGLLLALSSQLSAQASLHPFVQKAKETSLYTQKINWEEVNTKFIEIIAAKEGSEGLKDGLQFLINSLGDKHASIRSAKDFSIVVAYNGPTEDYSNRDADFVNNVLNDVSAKFSYDLLEEDIAYLKVVGKYPKQY